MRFSNGESGEDVIKRQDSFLAAIKSEQGDIAVFTRDGYIRLLMCNLLGLPVHMRYKFRTYMGDVSLIDYLPQEDEWQIVRYNIKLRTIKKRVTLIQGFYR